MRDPFTDEPIRSRPPFAELLHEAWNASGNALIPDRANPLEI
jgi:hypothetical protein